MLEKKKEKEKERREQEKEERKKELKKRNLKERKERTERKVTKKIERRKERLLGKRRKKSLRKTLKKLFQKSRKKAKPRDILTEEKKKRDDGIVTIIDVEDETSRDDVTEGLTEAVAGLEIKDAAAPESTEPPQAEKEKRRVKKSYRERREER